MTQSFTHYWDSRFKRNVIKLLPGDFFACNDNKMIVTVLGSCIAACIQDAKLNIGGMNHFMLPMEKSHANQHAHVVDDSSTARYGNVAMERLINEIIKLGGDRHNMQAKIFGGGRITNTSTDIGSNNINFVNEYLKMENINIISEDVGGEFPRKVYYIPTTNDVYVKKIRRIHSDTILTREQRYINSVDETEKEGEITFL